jgi:protein KRI1
MKTIFDDSFYTGDENEKPTWDDDIDTGLEEAGEPDSQPAEEYNDDDAEDYEYPINTNTNQDDDDLMMDADYLPGGEKYAIADEASGKGKKSKKDKKKDKKKKGKMIEEEVVASISEPIVESKKNTKRAMEKYMEEYYNLNYEDMIGDLPTRFKYRKVDANNFGLSPVEILLADDKDLNQVAGLKTLAPYVSTLALVPLFFKY